MNYSDAPNLALLEGIYAWREHAWENAEVIAGKRGPELRKALEAEQYAWTIAQGVKSPKLTSSAVEQVAYCGANP